MELVSSAIGDLVQGIYYENSYLPEVGSFKYLILNFNLQCLLYNVLTLVLLKCNACFSVLFDH